MLQFDRVVINDLKGEVSMENNSAIVCIVVTHNPPPSIYKLVEQLSHIKIIIIDSSDPEAYNLMQKRLKDMKNTTLYHEEKHQGLGNALNSGVKIGMELGFKIMLIMEDDTYFIDNIDLINLANKFFQTHKRGILYLSERSSDSGDDFVLVCNSQGTNTGILITLEIASTIAFRSEFFMDQIDIDFQFNIRKLGYTIFLTKNKVIERLPIGRETNNGIRTISPFRFYLLTRNTIRLFIERKIPMSSLKYIPGYLVKGILAGQNIKLLFKALWCGILDGVNNNLGITETLKFFRPDLET